LKAVENQGPENKDEDVPGKAAMASNPLLSMTCQKRSDIPASLDKIFIPALSVAFSSG
jgi:hypothetical protein